MSKAFKHYAPLVWLGLGGAVLGFLAAVALVGIPFVKDPVPRIKGPKAEAPPPIPDPPDVLADRSGRPMPLEPVFPPLRPPRPREEPEFEPFVPRPEPPVQMEPGTFSRLVARSNMTCLILELLRHRSSPEGTRRLRVLADRYHAELKPISEQRQEEITRNRARLYCVPGDRVVWFEGVALHPGDPRPFVKAVESWLQEFQPGAAVLCGVRRGTTPHQVQMYFPERTQELVDIVAAADILLGRRGKLSEMDTEADLSGGAPGDDELVVPFPDVLISRIRESADPLPRFYRELIPEEIRDRARALLEAGRGTLADLVFLRTRYLDAHCRRYAEEYARLRDRREALEARMLTFDVIDVVDLKDGRRLGGIVLEEGEDWLVLKVRHGSVRIPRYQVQVLKRGMPPLAERRRRYEQARGNLAALREFTAWCRTHALERLEELGLYAILVEEPGDRRARVGVGLPPAWVE